VSSAEVLDKPPARIRGRFAPGHSGNPGGIPSTSQEIVKLARECSVDAIKVLHQIVLSDRYPTSSRVAAASVLLDRGFGRPKLNVEFEGDARITAIRQIIVSPDGEETIRPPLFGDGTVLDERGRPILDAEQLTDDL
jgi:hypothetical protein